MWRAVYVLMWMALASTAGATNYRAGPTDYREIIRQLQPGDRLQLEPGDYLRGLPLHGLAGQPDAPITIEAAEVSAPPRFIARAGSNTVSLVDVRYLILRRLELDGRNQPVDAIKAEGHSRFADFITLEHLYIHDHAASQQNVGISTKCPAQGWVIRFNRIERVGTGVYLGDADGSDPFVGGLIESNRITQTLGYNLQIKHQKGRAGGSSQRQDTIIRYNVFSKADALPGKLARPNVLLGHGPLMGPGSEDRYLVYGNLFLHNPSEALFQAEGRVALYDNMMINRGGDAVHIQPHNDVPRDMDVFFNTIVASGTGIQIRQAEHADFRQRVVANVIAAGLPIQGGEASYNVTRGYAPDLLNVPVLALTAHLRGAGSNPHQLPAFLRRELAHYPDAHTFSMPGARVMRDQWPLRDVDLP